MTPTTLRALLLQEIGPGVAVAMMLTGTAVLSGLYAWHRSPSVRRVVAGLWPWAYALLARNSRYGRHNRRRRLAEYRAAWAAYRARYESSGRHRPGRVQGGVMPRPPIPALPDPWERLDGPAVPGPKRGAR